MPRLHGVRGGGAGAKEEIVVAKRRTIRRFAITAIVFLLLGVIVNVAVVVYIAVKPFHRGGGFNQERRDPDAKYGSFVAIVPDQGGHRTISISATTFRAGETRGLLINDALPAIGPDRYYDYLPWWSRFHNSDEIDAIFQQYHLDDATFIDYDEYAVGWPLLAMRSRHVFRFSYTNGSELYLSTGVESLGEPLQIGSGFTGHEIPLRPTWPGFAINSALYGAVVWIVFTIPLALRRWNRTRRGLCSKCRYPVGHSPVCTECGAALPLRKRRS